MTVVYTLKNLVEQQTAIRKKFMQEAQTAFNTALKDFFDANPDVKTIRWTQYTPFFNDGEPCEFGVNDVHFSNADASLLSDWGELESDDDTLWSVINPSWIMKSDSDYYKSEQALLSKAKIDIESIEALTDVIGSREFEDVLLNMFGDHVRVTITRAGIDVEQYDHD